MLTDRLHKLRRLLSRKEKRRLAQLFFLMIIGSMMDVVGVGAIPAFVAALAIPEKVMALPVLSSVLSKLEITTTPQLVLWGAVGLIVVFLMKNIAISLIYYVQVRTTEGYRVRLGRRLFAAYMNAPYTFHLERNSAELIRNITQEAGIAVEGVINTCLNVTMATLMTLFIVALLVAVTPWVAVVSVFFVGSGSWAFLRIFRTRLHRYGKTSQREKKNSLQAVIQGLGGLQEARILGTHNAFVDTYDQSNRIYARAQRTFRFIRSTSKPVLESIAVSGLLLIVITLIYIGTDLEGLIPTLALFGAAIVRIRATLTRIVNGISELRYNVVAIDPIFDDLELLEKYERVYVQYERKKLTERTKQLLERELIVTNVDYRYPGTSENVLTDINLTIIKGTSVGFVGATGAGKTTLINLFLGLLEPDRGSITIDGVDIQSNLDGWRANIGYIPQTIYLLDDTIRNNITFGLPEKVIDDEKLLLALRAAQLEEFVVRLEDGLNTWVGERGVRLSGGQRQRIGLARALYHNPEVLIMDEATSSLDNQTENLVMKALDELRSERTFIMIAHRLSTVKDCDQLYFLKNGRIEAAGTFDELSSYHADFRQMADVT